MTATNKSFIDAYKTSPTRTATRLAPEQPQPVAPVLGGSEIVLGEAFSYDSINLPPVHETTATEAAATEAQVAEPRRHAPQQPAVRRPLSQVQAGELFGLQPQPTRTSQPQWPEACQELIGSHQTFIRSH